MSEVRSPSYVMWLQDQQRYGWQMPSAPRWKRLPVIRHMRAMASGLRVALHEERWASVGMLPSGYDQWVLYGIAHGMETEICRASSGIDQRSTGHRELLSPEPRQVSANNRGHDHE